MIIFIKLGRRYFSSRSTADYKPLYSEVVSGDAVEADDVSEESLSHLALNRTLTGPTKSILEVDKPANEATLVSVEAALLFGEVIINIIALVHHTGGRHGDLPTLANIVAWGYILLLACIRLVMTTTKFSSFPKVWTHTASLYGLQWILTSLLFRSALIHPRSTLARNLVIAEFSLISALLIIALTSRKGNKPVTLDHKGDLKPSKEPLASLFAIATFSWADSLVLTGYKRTLELSDVWDLPMKDKAAAVIADFRQVKRTCGLALFLLKYFKRSLLIQGAWAAFSNLFVFMPTLLLKAILEYVEDPRSVPVNAAWFYVTLLFFTSLIQAVADGQGLWIGRKISVRLRAIIIGEIYAKALRRKAAAIADDGEDDDKSKPAQPPMTLRKKIMSFGRKKKAEFKAAGEAVIKEQDKPANVGTVINLMSIDSFKVSEVCAYLHFLWASVPVQVTIAIFLLYRILGYSSFVGIVLMVLLLPLNMLIAKGFAKVQKKIMARTDARTHSTNEVLQNIRIIKYFAWETRFGEIVDEKRRAELKALRKRYILWSVSATLWYGSPVLITLISFFVYTVVEGKQLLPSVAFPALSMFSLLRIPLDQLADMVAHVQEAKVSVDRVEKFLNEEETQKYKQLAHCKNPESGVRVGLENATLAWGESATDALGLSSDSFRLINMNINFEVGKLNIVAGPTGSGKTSLLMGLLGEMKLVSGQVHLPGFGSREDMRVNPTNGLTESVAYCAQQAWLVNDTVKENIVFAATFDERRYREVLRVCALERDIKILDAGDQTLVGEKGITLSGGQKQRISLARAIYSSSRHLLLDDCLSAVDSHTARHIFNEALRGPLMHDRTCVLVTHNVSLTVAAANYVVLMDNGKVAVQGHPEKIIAAGHFGEELMKSKPASLMTASRGPSRQPSNLEERLATEAAANGNSDANGKTKTDDDVQNANSRTEGKAEGKVKLDTITMYLKAMGPWYYWIVAVAVFAAQQFGSVAGNIWIRQWANAYTVAKQHQDGSQISAFQALNRVPSFTSSSLHRLVSWNVPQVADNDMIMATNVEDTVDVAYYLGGYALIGLAYITISMTREGILFWGSLNASWKIHYRLLRGVLRAKFSFFDSTPLGQLMNRFSKDVEAIDQEVAPIAIGMLHSLAAVITIVILISSITPAFLIAGVFISAIYAVTGALYIGSSRDLKRLESVTRSPLFQQFGETLSGAVTIRAYGDESRFIRENHDRVNTQNRPYIYLWLTNRWLAFRVDLAGALVAFFAGAFVIRSVGTVDAGAAGLSLTYAITFTENVLWLVRLYASNEQNMNSVERVKEYLEVEQEAASIIEETQPPANWPSHGGLDFVNYTTRYRADLAPVLSSVTFKVLPGEKVGIVGRTGAGKSSLALALFRGLEAEEGKILIDGVDIGLIGLQTLREAVTMVPQDPTLFTGTIRSNLDPFDVFTDEQIFTALRKVHLLGSDSSAPSDSGSSSPKPNDGSWGGSTLATTASEATTAKVTTFGSVSSDNSLQRVISNARDENKNIFRNLKSPVTESGSNLSQGQRQLLCLARALLKQPRVLLMDEATASIDYATDAKIQDTLRELKNSTIITIAHRLQTIIDYDKVLVLDHGKVIEFGSPYDLIQDEEGSFRDMCDQSGELDSLIDGARKAHKGRQLVDVE